MNIIAGYGQRILKIVEDGKEKTFLVLSMDQLFEVRRMEPHRLRKIDGEWCVRVEYLN